MSQFRIEQRRAPAAPMLTAGTTVRGCFFLPGSHAIHPGPDRVADLLNAGGGLFRFVQGRVRVYRPTGRDRLNDDARSPEAFRDIETVDGTVIVNSAHFVELRETSQAS